MYASSHERSLQESIYSVNHHEGRVHIAVDVSGEFTDGAKWIVCLYWLIAYIHIYCFCKETSWKGWIAVSWGIGMIFLRHVLELLNWAYYFEPFRGVPMDPAIFLFAMVCLFPLLVKTYFPKYRTQAILVRTTSPRSSYFNKLAGNFYGSALLSSILTKDCATCMMLGESSNNSEFTNILSPTALSHLLVMIGSSLGSALTVNGNLHNVLIVINFAYDEIGWMEFFKNLLLPILSILIISFPCLLILSFLLAYHGRELPSSAPFDIETRQDGYEGVVTELHLEEEEHLAKDEELAANGGTCLDGETEDISTTSRETDTENHEVESIREAENTSSPTHVVICVGLMVLAYSWGADVILTSIATVLVILWTGRWRGHASINLNQIDLNPVLLYVGIGLLTASMADTGIPRDIWSTFLGKCYDTPTEGQCLHRISLINYLAGFAFTPTAATFLIESASPYTSPYGWLQISLHLSIALVTRSAIRSSLKLNNHKVTFILIGLNLLVSIGALRLASQLLQLFHFSAECSERLGECY